MTSTAQEYAAFAVRQAHGQSPCFEEWALHVAQDDQVLRRLAELPEPKRQPNLVFAAARWHGVQAGPYSTLRRSLLDDWAAIKATILKRSTQTNEAGRCATLLPLLSQVSGPVALLEVGAAAGLCLYSDRYSYRYSDGTVLHPASGPSDVELTCEVSGNVPLPTSLPQVVWRAGIDLNPLDVRDDEDTAWLQTLVWPEQEHRRRRLAAAIEIARGDPPVLVRGDLNETAGSLAAEAPAGTTLVIFHSAVLAYLGPEDRAAFTRTVSDLDAHWISNEGPRVLPELTPTGASFPEGASFVTALDGQARALTGPHGQYVHWLE
ncbi:MAG: DUF2332 domain-containing protein [Nocardioidaceae bacterium]